MDWNDIRYFLAAVRGGSLTAASRLLSCYQPTVGRRIDSLEQSLGVRLFHRHAQGLTLTDEGRGILGAAESMENAARGLRRCGEESEIRGNVSIASPEGLAIHVIPVSVSFHCDGRTHCSQMTSCAEAEFFLNNCPNVEMDGNNDGEPCEKQWCN